MPRLMRGLLLALTASLASCQALTQALSPVDTAASATQNSGAPPSTSLSPTEAAALKPAAVDTSRRFEYADVYVSMTDPTGQRQLAVYFMKPEVWTIDRFEQVSDTLRHYRFRRLAGQDGKSLPEVDPFNPPSRP